MFTNWICLIEFIVTLNKLGLKNPEPYYTKAFAIKYGHTQITTDVIQA
jgi:hypothetical protein